MNDNVFAVVQTQGKQYRVVAGGRISVDRMSGEVGDEVKLSEVLLIGGAENKVGAPFVANAQVVAKITAHRRGKKGVSYKKTRRKGFHKKIGFRQDLTDLVIERIV